MTQKKHKKSDVQRQNPIYSFFSRYTIFVLIVLCTILYAIIGITKYMHYQTGLDLAIYVQAMWFYTHLQLAHVTLYPTFGDLIWADHFNPSVFLLTPFYLLWRDPRMLIIVQSLFYCLGAYPVYRFTKEKTANLYLALSFAFSYLMFFGTQSALTFDVHMGTIAPSFLPWILWAMFRNKWKTFVILSIIATGFKEDMPLYIATLGLYLTVTRRNWKLGSVLFVLFMTYAFVVTKYIMPSFAHNAAKTFSVSYFSLRPHYLWNVFFNSPIKIHTMVLSFGYVYFLPVLSGFFLLLPLAHFFVNFSNPDFPGRWDIYLHYRAYLTPLLLFGSVLGYTFLMKKKPKLFDTQRAKIILAALIIINAFLFDVFLHMPLNTLLKKQFYYRESWARDNDKIAKLIPENAFLLTTNHLAPQVSYRKNVYYFPQKIGQADYIFLDIRRNQPIIDYWLTAKTEGAYMTHVSEVMHSKDFQVVAQSHDAVLLKRKK